MPKRLSKFGGNADVDTANAEDVWDGGGTHTQPTVAQKHDIVSSLDADDAAGTGARTIYVVGLGADYKDLGEIVTMDGTTNVATVNEYLRIYRMYVLTAGSGDTNAGDITATGQVDGTVTAQISSTLNQTLMAIYTVPAKFECHMTGYYASVGRQTATTADIYLYVREQGGVFRVRHVIGLNSAGSTYVSHKWDPPLVLPARCDIKITAEVGANNTPINAGFGGYMYY